MIPKLHYISQGNSPKEHLENIQNACSSGAELVHLHLKNISEKKHLKLAIAAKDITAQYQTRLIINNDYKIAKKIKADGVYLGITGDCPTVARKHLYDWQIIGGTANTLKDCELLIAKEVDYIVLGPFESAEIKDKKTTVVGLKGYTVITESLKTKTPIIGVGEIKTADVKDLLKTGVSGIAVSKEITQDFNTIITFNRLLNASSTAEQRYTVE